MTTAFEGAGNKVSGASGGFLERLPRLAVLAAGAMGLGLFLQPTLTVAGFQIRVSMADVVLLPLIGVTMLLLYQRQLRLPVAATFLAAAFALVMAIAYIRGALALGGPHAWATAKMAGTLVLLAYLGGGLAVTTVGGSRALRAFIVCFLIAGSAIVVWNYADLAYKYVTKQWISSEGRLSGGIDNPNALALAYVFAIALLLTVARQVDETTTRCARYILAGLIVIGLISTVSSSGWLGAAICMGLLTLAGEVRQRGLSLRLAGACTAGLAAIVLLLWLKPFGMHKALEKFPEAIAIVNAKDAGLGVPRTSDMSDNSYCGRVAETAFKRLHPSIAGRVGYNCLAYARFVVSPAMGAGLGTIVGQLQRDKPLPSLNDSRPHNTYIWLAAEAGIVGLGVYLLFVAVVLREILARARWRAAGERDVHAGFALAVAAFVVAWLVMSIANDFAYQRIAWFVMGLALGLPRPDARRQV